MVVAWTAHQHGHAQLVTLVAAILAFDLFGGLVVCAGHPFRQWSSRAHRTVARRAAFVLSHSPHVALVAFLFSSSPLWYLFYALSWLILCTVAWMATPEAYRGSVAIAGAILGVVIVNPIVGPVEGMNWFLPTLYVKVLVSYLGAQHSSS
jgi:hypothetical protein